MSVVLGIDNGTQSTKVLFYDANNHRVLEIKSAPHALDSRKDGTREQKTHWWIDALLSCLNQVDSSLKSQVQAMGVSGQQHGMVALDEHGHSLLPVKLWCDTSTQFWSEELTKRFGGRERLIQELGNPLAAGYTAGKVLWLKEMLPQVFSSLRWILLPHDYLNFWLTGRVSAEWGDASGTGFLDVRKRCWHEGLLSMVDSKLIQKFPPLLEQGEPAGVLSQEAAQCTGLPPGIPVSSGGGDNMMGAWGTGTVEDGDLTLSLGTSGTLYGYSSRPFVDDDGVLAAFCSSSGGWLPLLCTMNCTVATEFAREMMGVELDEMERLATASSPGASGVTMLPFFHGERVPDLPHGKASIMGLDATNTTRENILRSGMEAAVYGMRVGLDRFRELGYQPKGIRLTGGGSQSPLWRQMCADILKCPISVPQITESAAFGAALQALWTLDGGGDLPSLVQKHVQFDAEKSCEPVDVPGYDEGFERYQMWLKGLIPYYR